MNLWSPWMDPSGSSLRGVSPERYALADGHQGEFYSLGVDDSIQTVSTVQQAFTFSTHEKAVATARTIATVLQRPVDVIKLL